MSKFDAIRLMPNDKILSLIADCQRVQANCPTDSERWARMSAYLQVAFDEMAIRSK